MRLVAVVVDGAVTVRHLQQPEVARCQQVVDRQRVEVVRVVDVRDAALCQDLLDGPANALGVTLGDFWLGPAPAGPGWRDQLRYSQSVHVDGGHGDFFALPDRQGAALEPRE